MPIPVIDLFAGPGGLNEGFSHVRNGRGEPVFETILSVERDPRAHKTLELRALFRRLSSDAEKRRYFAYVSGKGSEADRQELFEACGSLGKKASAEAFLGELGNSAANRAVDARIEVSLVEHGTRDCVLIGGPPCQAYSLAGRSRRAQEPIADFEADPKHRLYLEFLRVVRRFRPVVFVMENVTGLLSAEWRGDRMFDLICRQLQSAGYQLHGLGVDDNPKADDADRRRFVVRAEEHGVPQARARIFIVGVRNDISRTPLRLIPQTGPVVTTADVLSDLPRIRSRLSREADSATDWAQAIRDIARYKSLRKTSARFAAEVCRRAEMVDPSLPVGVRVMEQLALPSTHREWYHDPLLQFVLNHNSRRHIRRDLLRYFFWSEFGRQENRSPTLDDVPSFLLPKHANVRTKGSPFPDRFRVQLAGLPATTITSHISRDGHYYIHHDSIQCRSLSVREAARLQTFPDNYYFEGPVTDQYHQVGNAVPPYLARQIGEIVARVLA